MPTAMDYMSAIVAPRVCFGGLDAEIANAQPRKNPKDVLQLPMSWGGQFAVVFCFEGTTGRAWAVKCFTSPVSDHQRRYREISAHLQTIRSTGQLHLPLFMDFEYKPNGIRVDGQIHPIVKMGWTEGQRLDQFINECLARKPPDVDALRRLSDTWIQLAKTLKDTRVAHGDLQHGNVLVLPNGEVKLVDYDGMYVPAFRGESQREWGMDGYQHKDRRRVPFDEQLDKFSEWVIYVTLRTLAVQPNLWLKYPPGDTHLFFTERDLNPANGGPDHSALFAELRQSPDLEVRTLAELLAEAAKGRYEDVPDFPPSPNLFRKCWYGHLIPKGTDYCDLGHPAQDRKPRRCPNVLKTGRRWVIWGPRGQTPCNCDENLDSQQFCMRCGYDIETNPMGLRIRCPECGVVVSPDSDLCINWHVQPPYQPCPHCGYRKNRKNFANCDQCRRPLY